MDDLAAERMIEVLEGIESKLEAVVNGIEGIKEEICGLPGSGPLERTANALASIEIELCGFQGKERWVDGPLERAADGLESIRDAIDNLRG